MAHGWQKSPPAKAKPTSSTTTTTVFRMSAALPTHIAFGSTFEQAV